jgi:citrate lyase subunit beta-like protein
MIGKSAKINADVVIYDLEDSISPSAEDKIGARERLGNFLAKQDEKFRKRVAIRVNDINTPFFQGDIQMTLRHQVGALVLPKIHSSQDLHHVSRQIHLHTKSESPLHIIASIESARGLWNIGEIAAWKSEYGILGGHLGALLFAAEDYCADTSIIRSPSRHELLYTRSQVVVAAKAFGLEAIDMVCINYQDYDYLKDECQDGRRLGFDGKQAIHPNQVPLIQEAFVPSVEEITRAESILAQMATAHATHKGAFGLELEFRGKEMIDAPMLKQVLSKTQNIIALKVFQQALKVIKVAKAAGYLPPSN